MRKIIAKGVYKEELDTMYNIKDISKQQLGSLSKDEINKYKEDLKEIYNNDDLLLRAVETEETQNLVNKALEFLKEYEKIYIVNTSEPDNFTEILKKADDKYEFKNIGDKAIL